MENAMERATLQNITNPDLKGKKFTEPYVLYHYLCNHERFTDGDALGGYAFREKVDAFQYEINGVYSGDEYWTNLENPGDLPSDTDNFILDRIALNFYSEIAVHYKYLRCLQVRVRIAKRDFTPWMLATRFPEGGGVSGYDQTANAHVLNNGVPVSGAMFTLPQAIRIERTVDKFKIQLRWVRMMRGTDRDGTQPWTLFNTYLETANADLGSMFFGVELHGVRERRVG